MATKKVHVIPVRMPHELWQDVQREAKQRDLAASQLMRHAVRALLRDRAESEQAA